MIDDKSTRLTENKKTINDYWTNKKEMAERAKEHFLFMERLYENKTRDSILGSKLYGQPNKLPEKIITKSNPIQYFENTDTVSCLFNHEFSGRIAILNFASYKHPGGGFVVGSKAQEEMLCHESNLYNIISDEYLSDYYEWNNEHKNKALYTNRAIYTPDVIFNRGGIEKVCDVITCAAPNFGTYLKYNNMSEAGEYKVLEDRMQFIVDIASENKINTLIAGAFGCGVFANNPDFVSDIWLKANYGETVKTVIHPVPFSGDNVDVFENKFDKYQEALWEIEKES